MKYFAYVQRPGEPIFRQSILAYQRPKTVVGETTLPELAIMLEPDANGVISIDEKHKQSKTMLAAVARKMETDNREGQPKRIVGPFDDYGKALLAAIEERPKTAEEQLALAQEENAKLRTALEGKSGSVKPGKGSKASESDGTKKQEGEKKDE